MENRLMYSQHDDGNHSTAACICGAKRSSSLSSIQPNPKREKTPILPLPAPVANSPDFPPLRRCTSDPVPLMSENAAVVADVGIPSPVRAGSSVERLCRSVSAPEKDLVVPSFGESPDSKRLKRMKERMREIGKWCDQVIAEGDEEGEEEVQDHLVAAEVAHSEAPKDDEIEGSESVEGVSVEKNGESIIIHMKCPCSKAYQFLLSGNNCYYKIM